MHVVQGYDPAIGGTERVIQLISERLVSTYHDDVTVYTTTAYNCELFWRKDQPSLPPGTETRSGVTVRRFPVYNSWIGLRSFLCSVTGKLKLPYHDRFRALLNGPIVPGMTKAIADFKADIIAASSFPLLHMHYALKAGKETNTPVVFYGGIHPGDDWGFNRPMIYKAIREVDACITYTEFEKDFLIGRKIPADKIFPIGVGVDPEPFEKDYGSDIRTRFGLGEAPVVLFVGQQVPHKGIDVVIDAMSVVWKKHTNVKLLIAGSRTTYSDKLAENISKLPAQQRSNIVIYDNFKNSEKPELFAAADMLAFPSCYESFGIVFIEAWSAGIPVIASRVDAIPSVIDDGIDGLLKTPHDPRDFARGICELLENRELRTKMGNAGRKKVYERYRWDIVVEKCRKVYQYAIDKKRGASVDAS